MSNCGPVLSEKERACIASTVESILDVSLPLYRDMPGRDSTGHAVPNIALHGTLVCNVINPTATLLQLYAEKIGSQRALVLRVMQDADAQEGDQVDYQERRWTLQSIQDAQSFSFTKRYLITTIAP